MKKIQYIDFQYKKNAKLDKNEILKLKKNHQINKILNSIK